MDIIEQIFVLPAEFTEGFTKNGGNGYRATVLKFLGEWMI
jgi:hypothetical protein